MTQWLRDRYAGKDGACLFTQFSSHSSCCVFCLWPAAAGHSIDQPSGRLTPASRRTASAGIVHAADGYLWVATLDGIAKFDRHSLYGLQ